MCLYFLCPQKFHKLWPFSSIFIRQNMKNTKDWKHLWHHYFVVYLISLFTVIWRLAFSSGKWKYVRIDKQLKIKLSLIIASTQFLNPNTGMCSYFKTKKEVITLFRIRVDKWQGMHALTSFMIVKKIANIVESTFAPVFFFFTLKICWLVPFSLDVDYKKLYLSYTCSAILSQQD